MIMTNSVVMQVRENSDLIIYRFRLHFRNNVKLVRYIEGLGVIKTYRIYLLPRHYMWLLLRKICTIFRHLLISRDRCARKL